LLPVRAETEPRVSTTVAIAHGSPASRNRLSRSRISCMVESEFADSFFLAGWAKSLRYGKHRDHDADA
jgi:hypothetical protein